jgi:hypothetical protein
LAEHPAVNRRVVGSSPTWGAPRREVAIIGAREALQQLNITLQQFLPAVRRVLRDLARVNTYYRKGLPGSKTAGAQADALDSYSTAVAGVTKEFRAMAPPPALRPWRASQMSRLLQIADTGHQLATALRVGDRNAVAGLIKRFRFLLSHQPNVSQAQHDAVKSYDNRLVGITRLQGKIQAEHQRLQNELG